MLLLVALAIFIGSNQSQEEIQTDYREQVTLVRLPLYVRRFGSLVSGLKPSDLQLLENGETLPIQQLTPVEQDLVVHILVDLSASNDNSLTRGKSAISRLINSLRKNDLCKVSCFSSFYEALTEYSLQRKILHESLKRIQPRGSTALYDGIVAALSELARVSGPKVLVVFTDGYDLMSETEGGGLRTLVHLQGVPLILVSYAKSDEDRPLLVLQKDFIRDIALLSDGMVLDGTRPFERELVQALQHYRERYDLFYSPPNDKDYLRWRSLEIRFPGCRDCILNYRRGFRLTPPQEQSKNP